MTSSRAEGGKVHDELRMSCGAFLKKKKVKKYSESGEDISKGHRRQPERAPPGQTWENVSMKISNQDNGL